MEDSATKVSPNFIRQKAENRSTYEGVVSVGKIKKRFVWDVWKRDISDLGRSDDALKEINYFLIGTFFRSQLVRSIFRINNVKKKVTTRSKKIELA